MFELAQFNSFVSMLQSVMLGKEKKSYPINYLLGFLMSAYNSTEGSLINFFNRLPYRTYFPLPKQMNNACSNLSERNVL